MDVVRHAQSDSKQQFKMNLGMKLIRMNLGIKLIFCMWLGIHKYIYLIQSIQMFVFKWVSKTLSFLPAAGFQGHEL